MEPFNRKREAVDITSLLSAPIVTNAPSASSVPGGRNGRAARDAAASSAGRGRFGSAQNKNDNGNNHDNDEDNNSGTGNFNGNNDNNDGNGGGKGSAGGGNSNNYFGLPTLTSVVPLPTPEPSVLMATWVVMATSTIGFQASSSSFLISSSTSADPAPTATNTIPTSIWEPRKGVNGSPSSTSALAVESSSATLDNLSGQFSSLLMQPTASRQETALGVGAAAKSTATSLTLPVSTENGMQTATQNLLVAVGTIGALIITFTVIFIVARMTKMDLFKFFRGRELRKGENGGWYGWHKKYDLGPPPQYTSEAPFSSYSYFSEEKGSMVQGSKDREKPQSPSEPQVNQSRQSGMQELETSLAPLSQVSPMSIIFPTLHVANPDSHLSLSPGFAPGVVMPSSNEQDTPDHANSMSRDATQMDDSLYAKLGDYNNTYNINVDNSTFISNNTVNDAYDPAQSDVNHLSYLSSISSGFGDQMLVPKVPPTPTSAYAMIKSNRMSRNFSWVQPSANRDTTYSTASVETAPHFRTVNSWVAQQAGRAQRRPSRPDDEIPQMPEIPNGMKAHQRNQSEYPAFSQHPGDEFELQKGSRTQSATLDRKIGLE
ncbi:hypothetical protein BJ878DRAFT_478703 [Calycina marina]|uniref:Uncharacterized protein n=1 Tax=Calycina marina TaxID=1763456 RepID=A0A9P7Z635_9HELO|nr:hypothetical protein BJ878DRAFT_478703 [Calycina marina]